MMGKLLTDQNWLDKIARHYGFSISGVTTAELPEHTGHNLHDFIDAGYHGKMGWMKKHLERRLQPKAMWADARTAIILGCNYGPDHNPLETCAMSDKANISVYARGRDYHDVLKGRLKQIASRLHARTAWQVKVFVDTAPLMEKPLAMQAGLGWQGKHTNLVSRDFGSWLFLGVILTDGLLKPSPPVTDLCGTCTACLDICPTKAFPAPYKLDARRCISYLTIEYDGHIDIEFRKAMGNRVFGCDDCLAVCPWNKFASISSDMKLAAKDKALPDLKTVLAFDEAMFCRYFSTTPVKRTGFIRFMRNILIAAGNAEDKSLVPLIKVFLDHHDPRLRAMAIWALSQYLPMSDCPSDEPDEAVRLEWSRE